MKRKPIYACALFLFQIAAFLWAENIHVDKVENIGPPINQSGDDFCPSLTADGKIMVFNSKRGGGKYSKIFMSTFENDKWSAPREITELSSPYHDETPFITPDGGFIFFSSDRDGSFEMPADLQGKIKVSSDIYVSKNIDGNWARPIKLPGTVNTVHHEKSPILSPDLLTIYYTIWPFGDFSKAYIMKAQYVDGEFINPEKLPPPVNTGNQDVGFSVSQDGNGCYFSSQRPGGFGGSDLYFSPIEKGNYGPPVNLGPTINSSGNDLHISIVNKKLFFCSNRDGGYGAYDIYIANLGEENILKFQVQDKKTGKNLSVDLNISSKIKKDADESITYEIKKRSDNNGEAILKYNPAVKDIDVAINENGYFPFLKSFNIPGSRGKEQLIQLVPIEKEASFEIHDIHFDFESAKIKSESFPYLNALADYMKKNPSMRFEIIGHTDLHGTVEFNNKLSLERAQAVKAYISKRGVDEKRFTVSGAGKSKPKVPKIGEGFDEQNRRTEFKLLEK